MSELCFVRFVETNDHEGETWNFWLQMNGNEEALDGLVGYLEDHEDDEDVFVLADDELSDSEVDLLVRFASGDYMPSHSKVVGRLVLPDGFEGKTPNDLFYKGGITDFFTAAIEVDIS